MSINFECPYCHQQYTREAAYMKHRCKQMERLEEMRTMVGQQAYSYYGHWMKQHKRAVPTPDVFTTSRYYTHFIKFAGYAREIDLNDPILFINLMCVNDIDPSLWKHERAYALYLERYERVVGPDEQARITINTILSICDEAQVDTSQVFTVLTPNEVIEMLLKRKFTPWLLLQSKSFKQMIIKSFTDEQRSILEGIIRPMYWKHTFGKHPEVVNKMKVYVKEMGL